MSNKDRTVVINVNQGSGLVEEDCGKGDTKLGGNQGQSSLLPLVSLVELVDSLTTFLKVGFLLERINNQWDVPVL